MIHLVSGGSGSGKSAFAESVVMSFPQKEKIYLATMRVYGEEGRAKVKRHIDLRADKGFLTIEKTSDLAAVIPEINSRKNATVILEDIPNLLANEMFLEDGTALEVDSAVRKLSDDLEALMKSCENLVVVTGEVFSDGVKYEKSTMDYIHALGRVNAFVADRADTVTEVVCGIPVMIKG